MNGQTRCDPPSLGNGAMSPDVTLAILAGGEGARMGMPKGLLSIQGRPILDYLLDHLPVSGPTLLVTAPGREHPPGWKRFTREVADPTSGGGPLRGLLTALEQLDTPLLFALTVDMPGVRVPHLHWMLGELIARPAAIGLMLRRTVEGRRQLEPFPSVYRADARMAVARQWERNRRSVHGLLEEPGFLAIDAPEDWCDDAWANLNVPSDVQAFQP